MCVATYTPRVVYIINNHVSARNDVGGARKWLLYKSKVFKKPIFYFYSCIQVGCSIEVCVCVCVCVCVVSCPDILGIHRQTYYSNTHLRLGLIIYII